MCEDVSCGHVLLFCALCFVLPFSLHTYTRTHVRAHTHIHTTTTAATAAAAATTTSHYPTIPLSHYPTTPTFSPPPPRTTLFRLTIDAIHIKQYLET